MGHAVACVEEATPVVGASGLEVTADDTDSVVVTISYPDGAGSIISLSANPDNSGRLLAGMHCQPTGESIGETNS